MERPLRPAYDHRNCQSLFGYAFDVHVRSRGTCQLCGCGGSSLTFELWRQLTVEHVLGRKQHGYLSQIREAISNRLPDMDAPSRERLSRAIDALNTVTACSFCNSVTSQHQPGIDMQILIADGPEDVDELLRHIGSVVAAVLETKKADVRWKLEAVQRAFDERYKKALQAAEPPARDSG